MNTNYSFPGEDDEIPGKEHEDLEPVVQNDDNYGDDSESIEEEARKNELSGPGIDLVSQPAADEDENN